MINNNLMYTKEQKIQTTATHLVEAGIGEFRPILLKPRKKNRKVLKNQRIPEMRHAESLCDQISNERAVAHFVAKQVHWGGPDKFRWKSDFNHIMPKVGSGKFGGNRANTSRDIYGEARF